VDLAQKLHVKQGMSDWIDNPEAARVSGGQQLLFPKTPRAVCTEIGLNWWAALTLKEDGWLNFDPETTLRLDESQEAELRFVGALVLGGCEPALLSRLLGALKKPYSYRGSRIYYDWGEGRWRLLRDREINPEAVCLEWIEQLKADADTETLSRLACQVAEALKDLRTPCWQNQLVVRPPRAPVSGPSGGGQKEAETVQHAGLDEDGDDNYPWEHVNASRHNQRLQQKHKPDEALARYEGKAKPCPKCGRTFRDLAWFYFESPEWTWENLCGRAGWMAVCDACHLQVDFFLERLN
jgi:hypothetical protein